MEMSDNSLMRPARGIENHEAFMEQVVIHAMHRTVINSWPLSDKLVWNGLLRMFVAPHS